MNYDLVIKNGNVFLDGNFTKCNIGIKNSRIVNIFDGVNYNSKFEDGINFNDKDIKAKWPKAKLIVSKKDKLLGSFQNFKAKYKGL